MLLCLGPVVIAVVVVFLDLFWIANGLLPKWGPKREPKGSQNHPNGCKYGAVGAKRRPKGAQWYVNTVEWILWCVNTVEWIPLVELISMMLE